MEGTFIIDNKEYVFHIENNLIIFNVDKREVHQWYINAKKKSYRFEKEIYGKTTEGKNMIILTEFIRKIREKKQEITLSIKAVLFFYSDILKINGINVQFNNNDISKLELCKIIRDNGSIIFDEKNNCLTFISEENDSYSDVLKRAFQVINVLRFILQCNEIGYLKVNLISDNKINGHIDYCNEIYKYSTDKINLTINEVLSNLELNLDEIFKLMNEENIYMAHIPENKKQNVITPGWFITIMAAFEWECRRFNFSNITDENANKDKQLVLDTIQGLIDNSTGKSKKHFRSYKKMIQNSELNLSSRLECTLEEYKNYIKIIAENRYYINNEVFNIKDMSLRLQQQRNNFAHGNLDKRIEKLTIIDIEVLRHLLYIMQLDKCNVKEDIIKNCYELVFEENVFTLAKIMEEPLKRLD